MADPRQTIAQWLRGEPSGVNIPWFSGRENGAAWVNGWGTICDQIVAQMKESIKARFPDYGPADALPHQAGDRGLILSQFELEANERTRIKTAWDDWSRVGEPAEFLTQLHWGGFGSAVLVQQNGLAYQLSAAPTAGVDPTSLLTITTLPNLVTPQTLAPTPQREGLTVSGTLASQTPAGAAATRIITSKTIPSGNPWWRIDDRTDLCNRFEVLFPSGAPALMTYGIATFSGTNTATVVWNNPLRFSDTSYLTLVGGPVVSTGSPPASISEDFASRTTTGTVINSAGAWTGYVLVIAWPVGANPFANISDGDLNALRTLIRRWKPACTRCVGIRILSSGLMWGWPPTRKWGDAGSVWGGEVLTYEAV
jgi:hypothetical protein